MASDIRLDQNKIVGLCHSFTIEGEDFCLTSQNKKRNKGNDKPRRALVHGFDDNLIINYAIDYRFTEIHGDLKVRNTRNHKTAIRVRSATGNIQTRGDVVLPIGDMLKANSPTTVNTQSFAMPSNKKSKDSLLRTIRWLVDRIEVLEQAAGIQASEVTPFPENKRQQG